VWCRHCGAPGEAIATRRGLPDDTAEAADVRADRLRLLREGDHRFFVVMEESLLRTVIGGADVMAGQLGHLITVASLGDLALLQVQWDDMNHEYTKRTWLEEARTNWPAEPAEQAAEAADEPAKM
jgi:hypothetical protein